MSDCLKLNVFLLFSLLRWWICCINKCIGDVVNLVHGEVRFILKASTATFSSGYLEENRYALLGAINSVKGESVTSGWESPVP